MVQFHEPLDQGGGVHRFHQHCCLVSRPAEDDDEDWWKSFLHAWVGLCRCPMMEGSDYPQSAVSPQSMDCVLTSEGVTRTHTVPLDELYYSFLCFCACCRWRKAGAADGAGHPRWHQSWSWKDWTHDSGGGDGDPEVEYSVPGPPSQTSAPNQGSSALLRVLQ